MSVSVPTVMISSTFYDLKHVREAIADFLVTGMAFEPLLSEYDSFPVDPDADAIENCRRRVEGQADVLILIIGGRYGSVDSASAKSITNLEYLDARLKAIPIFTFVDKRVLALLGVWERNPDADFSDEVDDVRVFEFVRDIRSGEKNWVYEFENAQQIIAILRNRFAQLTLEGIRWGCRFQENPMCGILSRLRGKALRIALEKPDGWKYTLFAHALMGEIDVSKDLRRQHRLGLTLGVGESVSYSNFESWIQLRLSELRHLSETFGAILNNVTRQAFGEIGQPGDLELIVFAAKMLGTTYREALDWSLRIMRSSCDEALAMIPVAMAKFSLDIIEKVEALGPRVLSDMEEALEQSRLGEQVHKQLELELVLPGIDEFCAAMEDACLKLRASGC